MPSHSDSAGTRFPLGRTVTTQGAREALTDYDIVLGLSRHHAGDWGDLDEADLAANERALLTEGRLVSVYSSTRHVRFYVITEADRSLTTVLLPHRMRARRDKAPFGRARDPIFWNGSLRAVSFSLRAHDEQLPRASERTLNPHRRRDEDIRLARLDFLKRSDIQVYHLCELFLGDPTSHALASDVSAESLQLTS